VAKNTAAVVDELEEMLKEGDPTDELDAALEEMGEGPPSAEDQIDLGALDLSNVVEKDFRLLDETKEYNLEIAAAVGGRSGAQNLQVTFTYRVIDCGPEDVDPEGRSLDGVTVDDYAGVDPKQPQMHWKIKLIGKLCGLYDQKTGRLTTTNPKEFIGKRMRFQPKIDREYNPAEPRNKVGRLCAYKPPTE
jgi:hypothetical protein